MVGSLDDEGWLGHNIEREKQKQKSLMKTKKWKVSTNCPMYRFTETYAEASCFRSEPGDFSKELSSLVVQTKSALGSLIGRA